MCFQCQDDADAAAERAARSAADAFEGEQAASPGPLRRAVRAIREL